MHKLLSLFMNCTIFQFLTGCEVPYHHFIRWGTTNLQLSNVLIVWPSYDLTCNLKGLNLPVKTFVLDNDSTVITIKANGLQLSKKIWNKKKALQLSTFANRFIKILTMMLLAWVELICHTHCYKVTNFVQFCVELLFISF